MCANSLKKSHAKLNKRKFLRLYTSLVELQIKIEEEIARNPISTTEPEVEDNPTDNLYQAMLPMFAMFSSIYDCLFENLACCCPNFYSWNWLNQHYGWRFFQKKLSGFAIMFNYHANLFFFRMTVLQVMKLGIDTIRHKATVVKAVSAISLLLLKYFQLKIDWMQNFLKKFKT